MALYSAFPTESLQLSIAIFSAIIVEKVTLAYGSKHDREGIRWQEIAASLLDGVQDHVDARNDENVKRAVAQAFYSNTCRMFFSPSFPIDSNKFTVSLRVSAYLLLSSTAQACQVNKERLRCPRILGGENLGRVIALTKEYLALDELLALFASLIPSTKDSADGRAIREKFLKDCFMSTNGPVHGKDLVGLLEYIPVADWDSTSEKIVDVLARDITVAQPLTLTEFAIRGIVSPQPAPSKRFYLDSNSLFFNCETTDGQYEAVQVLYNTMRQIKISSSGTIEVDLSSPPIGRIPMTRKSEEDPMVVIVGVEPDQIDRIVEALKSRGQGKLILLNGMHIFKSTARMSVGLSPTRLEFDDDGRSLSQAHSYQEKVKIVEAGVLQTSEPGDDCPPSPPSAHSEAYRVRSPTLVEGHTYGAISTRLAPNRPSSTARPFERVPIDCDRSPIRMVPSSIARARLPNSSKDTQTSAGIAGLPAPPRSPSHRVGPLVHRISVSPGSPHRGLTSAVRPSLPPPPINLPPSDPPSSKEILDAVFGASDEELSDISDVEPADVCDGVSKRLVQLEVAGASTQHSRALARAPHSPASRSRSRSSVHEPQPLTHPPDNVTPHPSRTERPAPKQKLAGLVSARGRRIVKSIDGEGPPPHGGEKEDRKVPSKKRIVVDDDEIEETVEERAKKADPKPSKGWSKKAPAAKEKAKMADKWKVSEPPSATVEECIAGRRSTRASAAAASKKIAKVAEDRFIDDAKAGGEYVIQASVGLVASADTKTERSRTPVSAKGKDQGDDDADYGMHGLSAGNAVCLSGLEMRANEGADGTLQLKHENRKLAKKSTAQKDRQGMTWKGDDDGDLSATPADDFPGTGPEYSKTAAKHPAQKDSRRTNSKRKRSAVNDTQAVSPPSKRARVSEGASKGATRPVQGNPSITKPHTLSIARPVKKYGNKGKKDLTAASVPPVDGVDYDEIPGTESLRTSSPVAKDSSPSVKLASSDAKLKISGMKGKDGKAKTPVPSKIKAEQGTKRGKTLSRATPISASDIAPPTVSDAKGRTKKADVRSTSPAPVKPRQTSSPIHSDQDDVIVEGALPCPPAVLSSPPVVRDQVKETALLALKLQVSDGRKSQAQDEQKTSVQPALPKSVATKSKASADRSSDRKVKSNTAPWMAEEFSPKNPLPDIFNTREASSEDVFATSEDLASYALGSEEAPICLEDFDGPTLAGAFEPVISSPNAKAKARITTPARSLIPRPKMQKAKDVVTIDLTNDTTPSPKPSRVSKPPAREAPREKVVEAQTRNTREVRPRPAPSPPASESESVAMLESEADMTLAPAAEEDDAYQDKYIDLIVPLDSSFQLPSTDKEQSEREEDLEKEGDSEQSEHVEQLIRIPTPPRQRAKRKSVTFAPTLETEPASPVEEGEDVRLAEDVGAEQFVRRERAPEDARRQPRAQPEPAGRRPSPILERKPHRSRLFPPISQNPSRKAMQKPKPLSTRPTALETECYEEEDGDGLQRILSVMDEITGAVHTKITGRFASVGTGARDLRKRVLQQAAMDSLALHDENVKAYNTLLALDSAYSAYSAKRVEALAHAQRVAAEGTRQARATMQAHDRAVQAHTQRALVLGPLPETVTRWL
ncbi:hypothetical protein BV25DRAFT_1992616 [Artomyces pyxidatus]|uniref:Uncharacterized protein n=1 Tax=Artomyces pyxidatus TaxID=48021 RepID=A0ACB8SY87_9AGAM|nr:hypothetical protein BV25DRAFT_1992616 [Artomyces pyxidatus]